MVASGDEFCSAVVGVTIILFYLSDPCEGPWSSTVPITASISLPFPAPMFTAQPFHPQEIIPGRLFFACVKRPECVSSSQVASGHLMFEIDNELVYEPFFADFGPLNMGKTYRFCQKVTAMLAEADRAKRKMGIYQVLYLKASAEDDYKIGIYQVMYLKKSAEDAYKVLMPFKPFSPFRDASCGPSSFHLTVFDCLKGMQKLVMWASLTGDLPIQRGV
eukprot:gene31191-6336_t